MIQHAQFTVHTDQIAHYKAIRDRMNRPRRVVPVPAVVMAAITPEPEPEPVEPEVIEPVVADGTVSIECIVDPKRPRFTFIEEVYPTDRKALPMREVLLEVAAEFRLHPFDITSARRHGPLLHARFALYYFLRERTKKSLPEIGLFTGGRDHTTVMHGLKRAAELLASDPEFAAKVEAVQDRLERAVV